MKTPEEIKEKLEEYFANRHDLTFEQYQKGMYIIPEAIAYIKELETDLMAWGDVAASPGAVEDMARENAMLTKYSRQREKQVTELSASNVKLQKEISQLKAERDAAVGELVGCCHVCCWKDTEKCASCHFNEEAWNVHESNWEWQGIQKED